MKKIIEIKNDEDNWTQIGIYGNEHETRTGFKIDDLETNTKYFIRSKLKNNNGMSKYSTIVPFTTLNSNNSLLNRRYESFLLNLIKKTTTVSEIELIYDAKRDGFEVNDYFAKCLNVPEPTITIIESNYGHIFGGYITVERVKTDKWVNDVNSFLFQLKPEMKQYVKNPGKTDAVYMWNGGLIAFGQGHNILVHSKGNTMNKNYVANSDKFTYKISNDIICGGNDHTHRKKPRFNFVVQQIQVYKVIS